MLTITRKKTLVTTEYSMLDTKLKYYDHHPYLGVEIAQDLDWEEHIKAMITKAHRSLNLLCRNLSGCSRETYNTMVRPIREYAGVVWEPYWHPGEGAAQGSSICLQRLQQVLQCVRYDVDAWLEVLAGKTIHKQVGNFLTRHITIRRHVPSHHTPRWRKPEQGPVMTSKYLPPQVYLDTSLAFSPDVPRPGTSYHYQ